MRATCIQPCLSRSQLRVAITCSQTPCGLAPPARERHTRRINVLQWVSASTDTAVLAQLSTRGQPLDTAACLPPALPRRTLLAITAIVASTISHRRSGVARAEEAPVASPDDGATEPALTEYSNAKQQYRLMVPAAWDPKGKAGADVLFEDPARRSTSLGVTVNPVKVASIAQFGGLEEVGAKLLDAERRKESTLGVQLVSSSARQGATGATLYEYEYELDSTRGRKRILNTVTIYNSRLYILNASFKCDKEGCGQEAERGLQLLRRLAGTFDVTSG